MECTRARPSLVHSMYMPPILYSACTAKTAQLDRKGSDNSMPLT